MSSRTWLLEPSAKVTHVDALEVHAFNEVEQVAELGALGWREEQPGLSVCVYVVCFSWTMQQNKVQTCKVK